MLSPLRMGVRTALNAVAVVERVLAVALCVLVVVDSFDVGEWACDWSDSPAHPGGTRLPYAHGRGL